jgi:hypothetical protein
VARRVRARPVHGGAVPGVPGPAAGVHPVDRQPAADPVRPARRRGRSARAARPRRRLARGLRRRVRRPGPVRGASADVRGGHQGRVLAGLLGLLVGRGRQQPPGALAVPRGGAQVRRCPDPDLGRRARGGGREPAAGRGRQRRLAVHPGRAQLRGRPRSSQAGSGGARARGPGRARPGRPGADRRLGPGRRPAAGRAGAASRRGADPGDAAGPAVGIRAGVAGPGPGRAGPPGPAADAAPAGAPPSTSGWNSASASSC